MRILLFIGMVVHHVALSQPMLVMSYNIRFDNPADGANAWPHRLPRVVSLIQKYDPDVIGLQEALHHQIQDLIRQLPDYAYVGVGRDDGKEKGEYSAILYKRTRFGLLSNATFWLSETPEEPGSKSWDAAITRVATWARLYDRERKEEFLMINTHFDHIGVEARTKSAALLVQSIPVLSFDYGVIITGDFNFTPDEAGYHVLTQSDSVALQDAVQGPHRGTYCGFEINAMECTPIDYIFHSSHWRVISFRVLGDNDGVTYPSDHLPVLAVMEMQLQK